MKTKLAKSHLGRAESLTANKLKLDLQLIDLSLAQDSLAQFVKQAWSIIEPATPIVWNWHLDVICEYLEAVTTVGGIRRLIINLPPRSGKSLLASVLWPAWVWSKRPSERWLFASYAARLSEKHSIDRRTVITCPWYQERWPIQLSEDQNQKTEFVNTMRGHMIATSLGGTATGKGGNFILADDLQNPEMSESDPERKTVLRFFDETLSTRLDDKRHGRIVVIQQRTHQADLTGHLLEQGGWTHLCLPAEFEQKTIITLPVSNREIVKEEGDLLWPEREGPSELAAIKNQLGTYGYACQYLQNPIPRGGNLFKAEWLQTYNDVPAGFDDVVLSLDCAFKTGASADYSAAVIVGYIRTRRPDGPAPGYYVLRVWRGRVEFAVLKRKIVELYKDWPVSVVLIEDAASGQSIIQELRSETSLPVKPVRADRDKVSRATAVEPAVEGGLLRLPVSAPWLTDFVAELNSFPGGAHDDQTDALVQALNYLRHPGEPAALIVLQASIFPEEYPELTRKTRNELALEHANRRLRLEQALRRCRICKLPIPPGSHIRQGEFLFHVKCHNAGKPVPL